MHTTSLLPRVERAKMLDSTNSRDISGLSKEIIPRKQPPRHYSLRTIFSRERECRQIASKFFTSGESVPRHAKCWGRFKRETRNRTMVSDSNRIQAVCSGRRSHLRRRCIKNQIKKTSRNMRNRLWSARAAYPGYRFMQQIPSACSFRSPSRSFMRDPRGTRPTGDI